MPTARRPAITTLPPSPEGQSRRRRRLAIALALALLTYALVAVLLVAVLFLPVMLLAGPHSDLLPGWLQSGVLLLAWLMVFGMPAVAARWVYRRIVYRGEPVA